jgi:hypothetical protein
MKKLMSVAAVLCLLAMATAAFAQPEDGDIGVVFDLGFTQPTADPPRFTTNNLAYVLAYNLTPEVCGYEFGLVINPLIIIFASVAEPPGNVNLGPAPTNWIVGTGSNYPGTGIVKLVTLTYGTFDASATDMAICLTPSTPSSFNPPSPGWLECGTDLLFPFGIANHSDFYGDGCGVLFPTAAQPDPVGADQSSWGSVKAQF